MDQKKAPVLLVVIVLLLSALNMAAAEDYYICLGSFTDNNNSEAFGKALNASGIKIVYEDAVINGRAHRRVLLNNIYRDIASANKKIKELYKNEIIKSTGINDIWIRPGKLQSAAAQKKTVAEKKDTDIEGLPADVKTAEVKKDSVAKPSSFSASPGKDGSYKIVDKDGYANCIFSDKPIELGKENNNVIKTVFTSPEPVYARSYFPGPVGKVNPEDLWHELWIDGRMAMRTFYKEAPAPEWDQIQIWITETEYAEQMTSLEPGEHEIIIWVTKNEYQGQKAVAETNAAGEITAYMKDIWVPKGLSKGKFTYIVTEGE